MHAQCTSHHAADHTLVETGNQFLFDLAITWNPRMKLQWAVKSNTLISLHCLIENAIRYWLTCVHAVSAM